MATHPKGSKVIGTVKEVDAKGALIELDEGIEGYVSARDIANERVDDATQYLKVGDSVEAKFIGMDRKGVLYSCRLKPKMMLRCAKFLRNINLLPAVLQNWVRC